MKFYDFEKKSVKETLFFETPENIYVTPDEKIEFIDYGDKVFAHVKTEGIETIYPWQSAKFKAPAKAVLMDLDGTTVHSEEFWIWIIEQTIAKLLKDKTFKLENEDFPFVSGFSVTEHLNYCIEKYDIKTDINNARDMYHKITDYEMGQIAKGKGNQNAFKPAPGLKDFLMSLKSMNIKIALVTSGLYQKAMPEIISAFKQIGLGNPEDFYDCIITAGNVLGKGKSGTLGELSAKPHPWLYAETAQVGLGIETKDDVIVIEDSSAGLLSARLAGYAVIGVKGGNISDSGLSSLLYSEIETLNEALDIITG